MANLLKVSYTDAKTGESRKSAKWYGQYRDSKGKVCRTPLSADKGVAQRMLRDLLTKVDRQKAGFDDRQAEHRNVSLTEHLDAYRVAYLSRGHAERGADQVVSRILTACEGCRWTLLADLDAESLSEWLAARRARPRKSGGLGMQTSNHYLTALKAFAAWCVRSKRVVVNPFTHSSKLNVAVDVRHARREYAPHELAGMMAAARAGKVMRKVPGQVRAALYLTASMTGLRSAELASLTKESFKLDAATPVVVVEAAYSKRRRKDSVPLHAALVEQLRPWLAAQKPGVKFWERTRGEHYSAGEFIRRDLGNARSAWIAAGKTAKERAAREAADDFKYQDSEGRFLDFHSLRHTFITNLVRAGVMPAVAMKLARHSTITLTIDRYAHVGEQDAAASLAKLAPPPPAFG